MWRVVTASLLVAAAGVLVGSAQQSAPSPEVSLRELVPGHYLFVGGRYNGGVIATDDGLVVVDAVGPEEVGRQQRALIGKQLQKPVRYLVSSTFHNNYSEGNVGFADVTKIGTERYRIDLLALMQRDKVPAADQRARMPTETFENRMTLYLGGKEIRIMHLGRGHTAGDCVVYVPEDRVVYASELYFHEEYPNFAEGWVAWADTLGKLEALDADIFVPGHGDMPANPRDTREGLRRARQRLTATRDAVQREIARGSTEDQAVKAIQFPEYEGLRNYPQQKDVAVRRMYKELKGQLP